MKTLLSNGSIFSDIPHNNIIKNGYLGIENDRIIYLSSEKPQDHYDQEINCYNHLLVPGFYNMHTHASMAVLRGAGSGLPLQRWLTEAIFPHEAKMRTEDYNAGMRISMMEMIASGVVSFSDMYFRQDAFMQDVLDSGMRANINRPMMNLQSEDSGETEKILAEIERLYKEYNGAGNGRIIIDFGIHSEYLTNEKSVKKVLDICQKYHSRMELHLSETQKENEECITKRGKTPTQYLFDLGVFDVPIIAAHCVWLTEHDMDLLKEADATIVHNPSSNLKLGSGFIKMHSILNKGIRTAIGTDGSASNNNQNLLEEMHIAALLSSGINYDAAAITAPQILKMATINGAEGQGRNNCGTFALGNKADIISFNLDSPHMHPDLDPAALLIYSAQSSDIDMNIIDGKMVYKNGEFLTIDKERAIFDLEKSVNFLF